MSLFSAVNVNSQVEEILNGGGPPTGKENQMERDLILLKNTLHIIHWLGDVSLASSIDKEKGKVTADKIKSMKIKLKDFLERYKVEKDVHQEIESKLKEYEDKLKKNSSDNKESVEEDKEKIKMLEQKIEERLLKALEGKTDRQIEDVVKEYEIKIATVQKETESKWKAELETKKKKLDCEHDRKLNALKAENEKKLKALREEHASKVKAIKEDNDSKLKTIEESHVKKLKALEKKTEDKFKKLEQAQASAAAANNSNEKKKFDSETRKSLEERDKLQETIDQLNNENETLKKNAVFFEAQSHLKDRVVEYYKQEADNERRKRMNSELAMELTTMNLNDPAMIIRPHDEQSIEEITGSANNSATRSAKAKVPGGGGCGSANESFNNGNGVSVGEEVSPCHTSRKSKSTTSPSRRRSPQAKSIVIAKRNEKIGRGKGKTKKRFADSIIVQQESIKTEEDDDIWDEEASSPRRRPKRNTRPPSRLSEKVVIATAVEREGMAAAKEKEAAAAAATTDVMIPTTLSQESRSQTDSFSNGHNSSFTNYDFRPPKHEISSGSESSSAAGDSDSESQSAVSTVGIGNGRGGGRKNVKRNNSTAKAETEALDLTSPVKKENLCCSLCGRFCGKDAVAEEGESVKCDGCKKGAPSHPFQSFTSPSNSANDVKPCSSGGEIDSATASAFGVPLSVVNAKGANKQKLKYRKRKLNGNGVTGVVKKKKLGDVKKRGKKKKISSTDDSVSFSSTDLDDAPITKKKGRQRKSMVPLQESTENESVGQSDESVIANLGIEFHHRVSHAKGLWACFCGKVYSNDERLKYHMISGLFGDLFKCTQDNCGVYFHHFKVFKNHLREKHGIEMNNKYGCLLCGLPFLSFKGLRDHYKECPNRGTLDKAMALDVEGAEGVAAVGGAGATVSNSVT